MIYHTIYAYMYEKEKNRHKDFYSGNKCINNINSMFETDDQ